TVPTVVVLFAVYPLKAPRSVVHFLAFFFSSSLSFFIVAGINFAVGTLAIRLKSILGLLRAKYFLLELFSGLLIPISFFPHGFQVAFAYMPFQYISYIPVLIYLGKLNGFAILRALGLQLFWVAALIILGGAMWSWSSRRITIQGG
ncbi:MAG: ABC-2 family transporter protein, partial [Nitrososphaerales archaeon]